MQGLSLQFNITIRVIVPVNFDTIHIDTLIIFYRLNPWIGVPLSLPSNVHVPSNATSSTPAGSPGRSSTRTRPAGGTSALGGVCSWQKEHDGEEESITRPASATANS